MIFLMRFEMLGELCNALTQDCDLHFWRTSIGLVGPIVADDLLLTFSRQCHYRVTAPCLLFISFITDTG